LILYESKNSDFSGIKVGSRLNNSSDADQNDSFGTGAIIQIYNNLRDGRIASTVSTQGCVWI
jgi:hypothetical protein